MTMYFCKNTRGFFDSSIGEVPKNAVEISNELHLHLLEEQAKGGSLKVGKNGVPYVAIAEAPSDEFLKDSCKQHAKRMLFTTDWAVLPDVSLLNHKEFLDFRAKMRALVAAPVADPVWPTLPTPQWSSSAQGE